MMSSKERRQHRPLFSVEPLEGRQLLAIFTGPSMIRPVATPGGVYKITVTGGGVEKVHQSRPGVFDLDLFGTTSNSTVTVSLLRARLHFPLAPLQLGGINVRSGQLDSIQAPNTDLIGPISPLSGSVTSLQFGAIRQNAQIDIGGDLGSLNVGNVDLGSNGSIKIGGNLNNLTVDGFFRGKGTSAVGGVFQKGISAPDLIVGLDLSNLKVLGGGADMGGLQGVNFNVGKDIAGMDVRHGIFNSFMFAGVLIDGSPIPTGGNIGPDGSDAVVDSEIRAGAEINHFVINGNVRSNFASNSNASGYRTRIVAGEDLDGNFTSSGNIDNFQITGAMYDSVLAASVAPNGGDGTLPDLSYGVPPGTAATPDRAAMTASTLMMPRTALSSSPTRQTF